MGSAYFDAHSLWQRSDKPLFTAMTENLTVDTCIIGAGIAGLSVAYQLLRQGQKVVVLDRERIGLGETGLTSAHLSNVLDSRFANIERWHGRQGARLAAESHAAAIDCIAQVQSDENIDCEFKRVPGYLFAGPGTPLETLTGEMAASRAAGLHQARLLPRAPLEFFDTGPCIEYPDQAQFHPIQYLDGLTDAIVRLGGAIFTHAEVQDLRGGHPAEVHTSQGFKVQAEAVVVATNTPINNIVTIHTKNAAYRTYVAGVVIPPHLVSPALLWDTADPYHYLRFVKDPNTQEDILLVGGEDHRTGHDTDPEQHFLRLKEWIHQHLNLTSPIVTRWSGQIMESLDGLAYIGRNPGDFENVYIVTGDCGHGLTHGTIAGLLLSDLILGRSNPWATLYDPSRLHFRNLGRFLRETLDSTLPYSDWLKESDVADVHQIEAGEGAVLRSGLNKIAVYKDEVGRLHSCSAVCTHLGGLVRWNTAEKTWDCPCHGSRYDRYGQVLNGPANKELSPAPPPLAGDSPVVFNQEPDAPA